MSLDDDLTESPLKFIDPCETRCPGCEEKLYKSCLTHMCKGEHEGQHRMDHIVCTACFGTFYVINGDIGVPKEGEHCKCKKPKLEFKC